MSPDSPHQGAEEVLKVEKLVGGGLLSTGPTPSNFVNFKKYLVPSNQFYSQYTFSFLASFSSMVVYSVHFCKLAVTRREGWVNK